MEELLRTTAERAAAGLKDRGSRPRRGRTGGRHMLGRRDRVAGTYRHAHQRLLLGHDRGRCRAQPGSNASGRDGLTSSSIVPSPSSIPRTYATPSPALALRRRPARVPSLKRLTVRLKTSTSLGSSARSWAASRLVSGGEVAFWVQFLSP